MKKVCTKCGEEKGFEDFYKNKYGKYGLESQCIACKKLYSSARRQYKREYDKKYRKNNKERISNYFKDYYEQNKEKLLDYRKNYNTLNKKAIAKRTKEYRAKNMHTLKTNKKYYYNESAKYETYKDKLTVDELPKLANNGTSLEVKCRYCGKYFKPTNQQVSDRIKALTNGVSENSLYCSMGCKKACPIFGQQKYPKGFKQATSREVQPELRQLVFERDDYTCKMCGNTKKVVEIHCHHILPLNESPVESADMDNCITLCKKCHKRTHSLPNCSYNELKCSKE